MADRYTIEEVLGRGGFGTVYGASAGGGERVAVKVFSRSEGLAPRADREARTARKLDHPNIHTVLGVEGDDDHVYLISKLVVGERLDRSGLTTSRPCARSPPCATPSRTPMRAGSCTAT